MLQRTLSAAFLNEVANDPSVRPWIGPGAHDVDLSPLVGNPANVALENEFGGFVLQRLSDFGLYELHSMFRPEGRGKEVIAAAREMFRFMFARTDCVEVFTKCPDDNAAARGAAAFVGFKERFRLEDAWSPGVGISFRVFNVDDWIARDSTLKDEAARLHGLIPALLPSEAHERVLGAALEMARNGRLPKAAAVYNRWAVMASYAPMQVLSDALVAIEGAIIAIQGGNVEIVNVRS